MVESNTLSNLFNLSDNAINALKKADLVQQIINLRGKIIVDTDLWNLCDQISSLSETITKLATVNQQINNELTIVKAVNSKLERRVTDLEKNQANLEQYSRRNNEEFSNIPYDIPDNQLEDKVIKISLLQDIVVVIIKGWL